MSVLLQDAYLDKLLVLNAGDLGSIPGLEKSPGERKGYWIASVGRSLGEGHGNPFQCSCWGNSMDRGACQARVHGVTKSRA